LFGRDLHASLDLSLDLSGRKGGLQLASFGFARGKTGHATQDIMGVARALAEHAHLKCPACDKIFVLPSNLAKHRRRIHSDSHVHVCQHCRKEFRQRSNLVKHLRRCHPGA
jgi:uncharacterized Zn-finger protein